jgi:hypothetical protein
VKGWSDLRRGRGVGRRGKSDLDRSLLERTSRQLDLPAAAEATWLSRSLVEMEEGALDR